MVHGLPKIKALPDCEDCILGKQSKQPFRHNKWRASHKLELVYSDLCGPMQVPSLGGSKYFMLFIFYFSRMIWVYFIDKKSEAFDKFKLFKAMLEKDFRAQIKAFKTNRGGEFTSKEFNIFCDQHGIKRILTPPYTPEHNGVTERKNRTVIGLMKSMLKAKKLPKMFWAEATATAVTILNYSPTKALVNKTPFKVWTGKKPRVKNMRVFGCIAFGLTPSQMKQKLDDESEKCIFNGYSSQTLESYRLYNPITKKIISRRDPRFIESAHWN
ncbi:putative RNA-directed DNA polymerase [Helianthus annuus]|nr:putative RNA-directed DNA polymerase [Helianthus annuus]KAJ0878835.1 putative RNA-directed DNA polymerase [Helianthus annuus]